MNFEDPHAEPTEPDSSSLKPFISPPSKKPYKKTALIIFAVIVLLGITALVFWKLGKNSDTKDDTSKTSSSTQTSTQTDKTATEQGLQLDPAKDYGNKYANGLLPVGDNQYTTSGAEKGKIYVCHANFVPAGQAGAQVRGPWFVNNNTQYDINKKAHISGHVNWQPSMNVAIQGNTRVVTTNDLPDHYTGTFPVGRTDPARQYDANPNTISAQSLTYNLAANPTYGSPNCVGGEVGVMLTGVALFDGFDAGGRDAGAWEVQDDCEGHPQNKGEYHYHTLSSCITDQSVKTVLGYALDGFPITGPKVGDNNFLTTSDLDECHGITSPIVLDGKTVTMYHYVMTEDFPYSVSCFRSTPIQAPGRPE